ncbi:tRNA-specific adenosine deaminase 1 isoform X7 [Phyllopteryx taeniolatus]|uniref:tRNA-specific adenosine deaminase 1 isoform X7 n=1 Tax=Phyllopteryx taeniolatus TaxID=161469 RepID=UPI002AD22A13|nr:tRNA-specific adenosine deaminase 1 isoform X7 [Phyllopteryx taeniolatus]
MVTADEIAQLCYERFNELPRRGKPEPGREWSPLAAVVKITQCAKSGRVEKEVVSLGSGTKCIGQTAMSPKGDVLNDSHAEVIARRGCIRYLTQELHSAVSGRGSTVFCQTAHQGKLRLQPGISFLFFTSHTPSVSWCKVPDQPLDVTASGVKQGVTKKALGTAKSRSALCKLELFHSFLSVVSSTDASVLPDSLRRTDLHTYLDYKEASEAYQQAWQLLRNQAFPLWPRSNRDLLLFK